MRTLILAAVAALGCWAATAPAAAVTINFGSLDVGALAGPLDYAEASFASSTGRLYVGAAGGDHALCPLSGSHCAATLDVTFSSPVDNLTFLADGDNSTATSLFITGVGADGAFEFTAGGFDGLVHTFTTIDLSAFGGITSISLANNDRAGLGYDNFSFDVLSGPGSGTGATVPEPATWALMLTGFGLIGSALRRRGRAGATA